MQQINLYLPEFQPNREPLRAVHMLWGGLAFFVLLNLFTVYSGFQNKKLEQQLQQEQQAQEGLKKQLLLLSGQKPPQAGPGLDAKISELQKDLQRHVQILSMISSQDLGNDKGFSAQVVALGQASMATISVESFSLLRGGSYAELTGKTRSADQIPLYLQRLRADPSFAHVGFGVLRVDRDEKTGGPLQFSLAKSQQDKTKSNASGDYQ